MKNKDLCYKIALTLLPGIGDISAKQLVSHCGSVRNIFEASKKDLARIPVIGKRIKNVLSHRQILDRAEEEVEFIRKNKIKPLFFLDDDYPEKLKYCNDSPVMLYYKGSINLNHTPSIAIVGTRRATDYGKETITRIMEALVPYNPLVISGMAYGIDISAHRAALTNNLPTVAVLAHGLDRLYPGHHHETAQRMQGNGGLLTDYLSQTNPDRENFPQRNRIVAGMVDAVLVIESAAKGGAMITANIANSYNREVFAVPGRVGDHYSEGCNFLIHTHKASIFHTVHTMAEQLSWKKMSEQMNRQQELSFKLNEDEQMVLRILQEEREATLEQIVARMGVGVNNLATMLLEMEFKGVIRSIPGRRFKMI